MARFTMPSLFLAAVAASAALAAPAGAESVPAGASAGVGLGAKLESCSTSGDAGRSAVFSASMPAIPKANRMEMRFDLWSRPDIGGIWRPVTGVFRFGKWESAEPGAGGLVSTRQVNLLRLGSAYRVQVSFRWRTSSGAVVRKAVRFTKPCRQDDPRPDLKVAARSFANRIEAVVGNGGITAPAFDVRLTVGGRQIAVQRIAGLGAGRARPIVFTNPRCEAGSTVKVTVDAAGELAERSEANNSAEVRCPASG